MRNVQLGKLRKHNFESAQIQQESRLKLFKKWVGSAKQEIFVEIQFEKFTTFVMLLLKPDLLSNWVTKFNFLMLNFMIWKEVICEMHLLNFNKSNMHLHLWLLQIAR